MAKLKKNVRRAENGGATIGYEAELWRMADALRGSMDAAECKHVVQRLRDDKRWKVGLLTHRAAPLPCGGNCRGGVIQ